MKQWIQNDVSVTRFVVLLSFLVGLFIMIPGCTSTKKSVSNTSSTTNTSRVWQLCVRGINGMPVDRVEVRVTSINRHTSQHFSDSNGVVSISLDSMELPIRLEFSHEDFFRSTLRMDSFFIDSCVRLERMVVVSDALLPVFYYPGQTVVVNLQEIAEFLQKISDLKENKIASSSCIIANPETSIHSDGTYVSAIREKELLAMFDVNGIQNLNQCHNQIDSLRFQEIIESTSDFLNSSYASFRRYSAYLTGIADSTCMQLGYLIMLTFESGF